MRIGLFTDTYRPSINGIVFVVESLKNELEAMGHEVYVFCPASSLRRGKYVEELEENDRVIRFPSVKGAFYDDYDTSIFFPPLVLSRVRELELDVIHSFTPGQVGLLGIQAAWKTDTPFVVQHCTDIYQFVEHYPAVLPGALALAGIVVPFTIKLGGKDIREIIKLYRPRRGVTRWNQDIIERVITIIYSRADAVITLSRKSTTQLSGWQDEDHYKYPIVMMPNGVTPIPKPSAADLRDFRETWGIAERDEVFGFVGRLGEEKNLPLLIDVLGKVLKKRPRAKLLFVGDFEFREELEKLADKKDYRDRIVFTGAIQRDELGAAFSAMKIFTFPSLKDTQAWVLHEAAQFGLPVVMADPDLSEVVFDGVNGAIVKNSPTAFANAVIEILSSPKKQQAYSMESKKLARKFTVPGQVKKLEKLYRDIIKKRQ